MTDRRTQYAADLVAHGIDRAIALGIDPTAAVNDIAEACMILIVGFADPGHEMAVLQHLTERMKARAPREIAQKCRSHLRRVAAAGRA